MFGKILKLARSKTVIAGALGAAGYLVGQPHIGQPEVLNAAGMLLGSAGLRDALQKIQDAVR